MYKKIKPCCLLPPAVCNVGDKGNQAVKCATDNLEHEHIRQRLLKRARFQVNFALSLFRRFPQEISSFPKEAISTLTNETFQYLNQEIIQ